MDVFLKWEFLHFSFEKQNKKMVSSAKLLRACIDMLLNAGIA